MPIPVRSPDVDASSGEDSEVVLDWYDESEEISVTPRDHDRFTVSKDRAIELLRIGDLQERRFGSQLDLLLRTLAIWIRDRDELVDVGYLTLNDSRLEFVVVTKPGVDRDDLHDDLSDLELGVFRDRALDLVPIGSMLLPPVSEAGLASFIDDRIRLRLSRSSSGSAAGAN